MASKIFAVLKKYGFIKTEGEPQDKLTQAEKDFEEIETEWAKTGVPEPKPEAKPAEKKPDVPAIDPAVLADIEGIKKNLGEITTALTDRQKAEQEAAKKSNRDAYVTHIDALVKDGKMSRAKAEELKKPENLTRYENADAVQAFRDGTADLPVNPAFKTENQATPAKTETPAQTAATAAPAAGTIDRSSLWNTARDEMAGSLDRTP